MSYLDTYNKNDLEELKRVIETYAETDSVVKEKLNKLNLRIVGEGANRIVVSNPKHKYVIKFRKNEFPNTENKREIETYNKFRKENISKILVPVIEHTENFDTIVQIKADQSNIGRQDVVKINAELIYEHGYFVYGIAEDNIGRYRYKNKNVLAVLDYGLGSTPIENTWFENKHEAFRNID